LDGFILTIKKARVNQDTKNKNTIKILTHKEGKSLNPKLKLL
jgi:hypothetical protein